MFDINTHAHIWARVTAVAAAGRLGVSLEGRFPILRSQETNFGNYLADLMKKYVNSQEGFVSRYGRVNFGMVNSGLIRGAIPVSPTHVYMADVATS